MIRELARVAAMVGTLYLGVGLTACGSSQAQGSDDAGSEDATVPPDGAAADAMDGAAQTDGDGRDAGAQDAAQGPGVDAGSDAERDAAQDALAADAGDVSADASSGATCDGNAEPEGGLPPIRVCNFRDGGATLPIFDKCCASDDDCTVGLFQGSCCGDLYALGINKSQAADFAAVFAQWSCAACGCATGGTHTEDGAGGIVGTGGVVDAGVRCDHGWCMTFAR